MWRVHSCELTLHVRSRPNLFFFLSLSFVLIWWPFSWTSYLSDFSDMYMIRPTLRMDGLNLYVFGRIWNKYGTTKNYHSSSIILLAYGSSYALLVLLSYKVLKYVDLPSILNWDWLLPRHTFKPELLYNHMLNSLMHYAWVCIIEGEPYRWAMLKSQCPLPLSLLRAADRMAGTVHPWDSASVANPYHDMNSIWDKGHVIIKRGKGTWGTWYSYSSILLEAKGTQN